MRVFHCTPLRSCTVLRWSIDGKTFEQEPQLQLEAGRELVVKLDDNAQSVCAIVGDVDGRPSTFRCPLPLGERVVANG